MMSEVKIRATEIRMVPIDEIKLNPDNSNIHTEAQIDRLCEIILDQGFRDPIDISNLSGLTPAGEGRVLAARKLGMKEIPCIFQDFDDKDQEWRHGIAHNSIAGWATLDLSKINTQMGDMGPFDTNLLAIPSFDVTPPYEFTDEDAIPDEPEDAIDDDVAMDVSDEVSDEPEVEEKEDIIPEKIEPRVKQGEIYRIGSHTLHNGDCLKVLKSLPSNSIDSLVTDPPAGIAFMGKEWDEDKGGSKNWIKWLSDVMSEAKRVMKPGAHGLVWAIPRTSHWTASALEQAGFEIRDTVCHIFGSGFPKSLSVEKALEKQGMLCQCSAHETKTHMSGVRNNISTQKQNSSQQSEVLQWDLLRRMESEKSESNKAFEEDSSSRSDRLDSGFTDTSELENDRGIKSSMGRGSLRGTSEGLRDDQEAGTSESEAQRLRAGTHIGYGDSPRPITQAEGSGSSSESQDTRQSDRKSETIQRSQDSLVGASQGRLHCSECGKRKRETIKGIGSALKPAVEFWWLIRKPIEEDTVAKNVLKHGTGGINIDASRIGFLSAADKTKSARPGHAIIEGAESMFMGKSQIKHGEQHPQGRFPANLLLSHNSDCVELCTEGCPVAELDRQSGVLKSGNLLPGHKRGDGSNVAYGGGGIIEKAYGGDTGGASRFFQTFAYVPKPSKREKNLGCEGLPETKSGGMSGIIDSTLLTGSGNVRNTQNSNHHPTVKSTKLMSYLLNMVTPPDGVVLDCFGGSGTTMIAAHQCKFDSILIEQQTEYCDIILARAEHMTEKSAVKING